MVSGATFSTWANETTAFAPHIIEGALAHDTGSAVERAYRRTDLFDKRRKLMEAWDRYCSYGPGRRCRCVAKIILRKSFPLIALSEYIRLDPGNPRVLRRRI